jgi:hypothetical protein
MQAKIDPKLEDRVARAAEAALARQNHVSVLDVLTGMGLLHESNVKAWQLGRLEYVGELIQAGPDKLAGSIVALRDWAARKGLEAGEAQYVRSTRNGVVELRIYPDDYAGLEKILRTRYISPSLKPREREKVEEKLAKPPEMTVFEVVRDSKCSECGAEIWKGGLLRMEGDQPLCMACANLNDLEFLGSGDAALTRRASKYSSKKAVVVRFSRSRGRYERQGLLLEPQAIERAEIECDADADERAKIRRRSALDRAKEDKILVTRMAREIGALFPGCPPGEALKIAAHTALRGSGRVGRTGAAKELQEDPLRMAVIAAIRHRHTNYDELLASGVDRSAARERVAGRVAEVLESWQTPGGE